jgi:hypothetical protein
MTISWLLREERNALTRQSVFAAARLRFRTGAGFAGALIPMSRRFLLSIILVLCVASPWVGRICSMPDVPEGFRAPRAPDEAPLAAPVPRAAQKSQKPLKTSKRKGAAGYTDYQVPAGAVLTAKMRTTVRSAADAAGDQVDAVLTEPVTRDGVELIPAGSTLHGTVIDVLRASPLELRGRIAVAFFVIEHAVTGSRAAIKTRAIAIDAPAPVDKRPVDVELAAGQPLNVVLSDPLLIHIPK